MIVTLRQMHLEQLFNFISHILLFFRLSLCVTFSTYSYSFSHSLLGWLLPSFKQPSRWAMHLFTPCRLPGWSFHLLVSTICADRFLHDCRTILTYIDLTLFGGKRCFCELQTVGSPWVTWSNFSSCGVLFKWLVISKPTRKSCWIVRCWVKVVTDFNPWYKLWRVTLQYSLVVGVYSMPAFCSGPAHKCAILACTTTKITFHLAQICADWIIVVGSILRLIRFHLFNFWWLPLSRWLLTFVGQIETKSFILSMFVGLLLPWVRAG